MIKKIVFVLVCMLVSYSGKSQVANYTMQVQQLNSINTLTAQGAAMGSYSAITIPTWTAATSNGTVPAGAHAITFTPLTGSTVTVNGWSVGYPYSLKLPSISTATYAATAYTVNTGTVMVTPLR